MTLRYSLVKKMFLKKVSEFLKNLSVEKVLNLK